jgi:hypothetical protein
LELVSGHYAGIDATVLVHGTPQWGKELDFLSAGLLRSCQKSQIHYSICQTHTE